MGLRLGRVVVAAACLVWLAGCETVSKLKDALPPFGLQASATAPDLEAVGSTGKPDDKSDDKPTVTPQLLGADPYDDLNVGKKYFRQGAYGTAERHFRKAVELHPRDVESWIGLAASTIACAASTWPTAPMRRRPVSSGRRPRSSTIRASPTCCAAITGAHASRCSRREPKTRTIRTSRIT
jgi:hypothetical protein